MTFRVTLLLSEIVKIVVADNITRLHCMAQRFIVANIQLFLNMQQKYLFHNDFLRPHVLSINQT